MQDYRNYFSGVGVIRIPARTVSRTVGSTVLFRDSSVQRLVIRGVTGKK
jgi:hypothetical protein